jgi:SRSO17 transposase
VVPAVRSVQGVVAGAKYGTKVSATRWRREFDRWLAPFWAALGDKRRRPWGPLYVRGLLGPGERKSVEPLAARVAPADYAQLHHFVCTSCWDAAPLERLLAERADALVGGPDAVLIVDDTALLKQGHASVGVARQYAGAAGKTTNCQTLVSLTLARGEVPVCIGLRLFLPGEWTSDPARCDAAHVPEAWRMPRTKAAIALTEIDRLTAAGVRYDCVLADTGYGASVAFRTALTARGLTYAVGIQASQKVYPAHVRLRWRRDRPLGPPFKHPVPTHARRSVDRVLAAVSWRRLTWRMGTKGALTARFAAVRVVVADGVADAHNQHLPGDAAWLVGEERTSGERKYYLTNHPPGTSLRALAAAIKARWSCEQAHQQMKEELGLDHFEGRTWHGLHHHALLTMISFAFLQHLRLTAVQALEARGEKPDPTRRTAADTDAACHPPCAATSRSRHRLALPALPRNTSL